MKIDQIIKAELAKLTKTIVELIPIRKEFRPFVFQVKDAMEIGLISKFEAVEVLKYNQQPFNFPCFK